MELKKRKKKRGWGWTVARSLFPGLTILQFLQNLRTFNFETGARIELQNGTQARAHAVE